jgi:hypothetical protein
MRQPSPDLVELVPPAAEPFASGPLQLGARARLLFAIQAIFWYMIFAVNHFRYFLISGYNDISGSVNDNRLYIYLLEHWYLVFHGQRAWRDLGIFYPEPGVLGYSDTFFLSAIPYSVLRLLGIDRYRAFEGFLIAFTLLGYVAMVVLLYRYCRLGKRWAILGALLFVFSNVNYIWQYSAQNYGVMFVPVLTCLVLESVQSIPRRPRWAKMYAGLAGAIYALTCFSFFYSAWFFALGVLTISLLYVVLWGRSIPWPDVLTRRHAATLLLGIASFAIFIIPFWLTYSSSIISGEYRTYSQVMLSSPSLSGLWNVGWSNLVYGSALGFAYPLGFAYALTPLISIMLIIGGIVFAKVAQNGGFQERILSACAGGVFVIWILALKVKEFSLWVLIWWLVPGAQVIRVTPRVNLVLSFFATLVVVHLLRWLWNNPWQGFWKVRLHSNGALRSGFLSLLVAVLFAEQLNTVNLHEIHRLEDQKKIDSVSAPPSGCSTGFLVAAKNTPVMGVDQIDAMLLFERFNLTTLNGYSGKEPAKWALGYPGNPDYLKNVGIWLRQHHMGLNGVCAVDLTNSTWHRVAQLSLDATSLPPEPGVTYLPPL